MSDERDDYLWDGSGAPDPEIQRLESLLQPLAHKPRATVPDEPRFNRVQHGATLAREQHGSTLFRAARVTLAIAAALVLAVSGWFGWGLWRGGWAVETIAGSPGVDGRALDGDGLLRRGGRLVTDGASRARISVGRIGRV